MSVLDGLRVVDFGQYIAAPLVARMLADHGADVVRVDPPGGPRWPHACNAILQRGKRSMVLDLRYAADVERARNLAASADVLIENFRPGVMDRLGLGATTLARQNPQLIYCSTPGFGADDPRAKIPADEGVVGAAAGLYASRDAAADEEPVFNTLPLASCFGAMIAANCIIAALIARQRAGFGQRIEVSLFDACFELIRYYADRLPGVRYPRLRLGATTSMALTQHYRCKDGTFVHLSWLEGRQLDAFAHLAGLHAEWSAAGLLDEARIRQDRAYSERVRVALGEVFATRTASEWMQLANPDADLAECLSTADWLLYSEQARATGAVISIVDPDLGLTHQAGYPVSMSRTPPRAGGPRHRLDADAATLGDWSHLRWAAPRDRAEADLASALSGFRAIDLTQILAGPTACRILAEYGAEVIQVVNPYARAGRDFHLSTNNGKRSILLDLKQPADVDALCQLIKGADVISTNFSHEVAKRLHVDEESVRQHQKEIVYSRISAYGLEGPLQAFRGHDQVGQAVTGMEVRWGSDQPAPLMQPHPLNDFGTGHLAAFAILLALLHRLRTGEGQLVGASLAQTATFLQVSDMLAYRGKQWARQHLGGQSCRGFSSSRRLFRASDRWIYVGADSFDDLSRLTGAMDDTDLEDRFGQASAADWVARLTPAGVGAHVLRTPDEAMSDPWAVSHGLSRDVEFPDAGRGRIVGPARRLSRTPMQLPFPAAPPGAHTRELLDRLATPSRR